MYDKYYTGSDVNVYLHYAPTNKTIHVDKAIGIGWNHSMSSSPVYVLGNINPAFFSRGNSLVQGSLDIVFNSTQYLKTGISYLLDKSSLDSEEDALMAKVKQNAATSVEINRLNQLQNQTVTDMTSISISEIYHLFDIIINFNNTDSSMDGNESSITIEDVKIINNGMSIYSTEESSLVTRIGFMAKNVNG